MAGPGGVVLPALATEEPASGKVLQHADRVFDAASRHHQLVEEVPERARQFGQEAVAAAVY
jgi:hypothetical protein